VIARSASEETWIQGRAVVPGIAFGSLYVLPERPVPRPEAQTVPVSVENEIRRFSIAVSSSQAELRSLYERLKREGLCQEADLVDMHLHMASDPELCDRVTARIRQKRVRADRAIAEVMEQFRLQFQTITEATCRQRYEDIEGICLRLLSFLSLDESQEVSIPSHAVLFARTVTAPVVAEVSVSGLGAIVTTRGGAMSHTAIVAKARGIPYVTNIQEVNLQQSRSGDSVIVDGLAGLVVLRPTPETVRRYTVLKEAHEAIFQTALSATGGVTKDGTKVTLMANVSGAKDAGQLTAFGLDGVGLYRTEYQVLERRRFPTEQEQVETYSEMVKAASGKPVVIRVFDFGSDKAWDEVANTLPGVDKGRRTIELLLESPLVFLAHLRAMIRASAHGPTSILFPMITSIEELDRGLRLYRQAQQMVNLPAPRVGAMIELPALAFRTRQVAEKVDFLSVGTNDLIQYALAVDRSNGAFFDPYLSYHPGLLRLLHFIAQEGSAVNIPLCVCGEMASDPLLIPFLIGLGFREFSFAPPLAPTIKHVLRSISCDEARAIAERVLSFGSAKEIYGFLQAQYCTVREAP
jgi:phosphotransferase system enzyme I (PtsI)